MSTGKAHKWSTKKKVLLGIGIIVVALAAVYIYYATQKYAATKSVKEDYTKNAIELIREFRVNDSLANATYSNKIIVVNGTVAELESADSTSVNIKFVDPETGDYIIVAFQQQYLEEARTVHVGDSIAIKGSSSGSSFSEIMEVYTIPFQRGTLHANYSKPGRQAGNP